MEELGVWSLVEPMQLVRLATDGELDMLWTKVEQWYTEGGTLQEVRSLVGVSKVGLPVRSAVWINDATADPRELEIALGRPIEDRTPQGQLRRHQPVLQVPVDVTRQTAPRKAASILRGLLHDLPYNRVGVITHQSLLNEIKEILGQPYLTRLAMMEYFYGDQARGSNDWLLKCDALIVLGTPRVPPRAVRDHLGVTRIPRLLAG